ncbi:MAG: AMP-binding protein [Candidatus Cloacimonetes bacterium]|nr:AMP-binding protein [Candidatus Cloacimonadota bacterium]
MLLQNRFVAEAKKYKKRVAIYDVMSGKEYTYERLLITSLLLKQKLESVNGHYLGIMIPTTAGCHISVLATLMAGKVPAMINYSTGAIDNCNYAQSICGVQKVLTSKGLLKKLNLDEQPCFIYIEDILKEISTVDKLKAALLSKLPVKLLESYIHQGSDDENCVILFTSGSEKDPKAVQLSHKNIWHNVRVVPNHLSMVDGEVFGGTLPLFHVFGLTATFWLPILNGYSIVAFANPLDYKTIVSSIRKYKISVLVGTPTFFNGYLKKAEEGDFESVHLAITGADKLPEKLRLNFLHNHNVQILEGYGTTETSPVVAVNTYENYRPGSIGKPIPEVQVKIIDRETQEELPAGETGKLLVKGELVMMGYMGNEEDTSLHIRNGWYDTGDMAMIDEDGYIWHKGRLRRFIKVGGEMVSLVRTEDALSKYLDEEISCCAVGIPDEIKGYQIVAAINSEEVNIKDLIHKLKKDLPPIAVPKEIYHIKDIPLMGSGKVNFREVERICRDLHKKNRKK